MLVVPVLLLLGAPAALAAQARPPGPSRVVPRRGAPRVARAPASPLPGAALSCAVVVLVYRTPLIELSQRSSWVHLLVLAVAVVTGLLLFGPVVDADLVHRPGFASEWVWGVAALAGCLALLAVQLRHGDRLMAGDWFLELRWSWVDPVADQRVAGTVVAVAAVAVLATALLPLNGFSRRGARS
jgi:putative copper resistance protein D